LTRSLAAEGARVAALDVNSAALEALAVELKDKELACAVGDVGDRSSLRPAVTELQERLGPIELLIANAGISRATSALSFRAEDVEAQIRVNLIGVANSIEMVLPGMIARKAGHLVAISSLASYRGFPKMAGYCASKSGVNGLMESLRLELKPCNVRTTIICPGWIQTAMTAEFDVPKPNMIEVGVAVRRIVEAIRREDLFCAFPRPIARFVGLLRWLPAGLSDWLALRAGN
jgi:NAD(P)-dependent dehydrogenase (short-subunit alcohol dehydrogenase family)